LFGQRCSLSLTTLFAGTGCESVVLSVAVLSHWVLDFIAHRADLPLAPGIHRYYRLGLYNSRTGMIVVEGLIWFMGIALYLGGTLSKKRVGVLSSGWEPLC
jgi:hypothetical protein